MAKGLSCVRMVGVSIRSNKGLLLTSYGQQGAQGNVLNMDETIAQLEQALALAKSLNKAAKNSTKMRKHRLKVSKISFQAA